jgi:DNA primase
MTKRRVRSQLTPSERGPGAPVPIDWKELEALKSGAAFGIWEVPKRRTDPWKDVGKATADQILPVGKARV